MENVFYFEPPGNPVFFVLEHFSTGSKQDQTRWNYTSQDNFTLASVITKDVREEMERRGIALLHASILC